MLSYRAIALAVTLVTGAVAFNRGSAHADVECAPDIKVDYIKGSGSSIKVTKLQYRLDGTHNIWHNVDVTDSVVDKGKSFTFKTQTLSAVAKGQKIELRAVFRADAGQGYGAEQTSPIRNSSKACENNVTYDINVD
jgi:hypothetical protein